MLSSAPMQANLGITNVERARAFYVGVLGLTERDDNEFALIVGNGHGDIRLAKVPVAQPSPYAVLSFVVEDAGAVFDGLAAKGVGVARFSFLQTDARGVWRAPDGTQVFWVYDPDRNLIGIVQPA
jgi:catechol 2,3-dioxygenase-like lactoylglutathione lyase family enzyme